MSFLWVIFFSFFPFEGNGVEGREGTIQRVEGVRGDRWVGLRMYYIVFLRLFQSGWVTDLDLLNVKVYFRVVRISHVADDTHAYMQKAQSRRQDIPVGLL